MAGDRLICCYDYAHPGQNGLEFFRTKVRTAHYLAIMPSRGNRVLHFDFDAGINFTGRCGHQEDQRTAVDAMPVAVAHGQRFDGHITVNRDGEFTQFVIHQRCHRRPIRVVRRISSPDVFEQRRPNRR